VFKRAAALCALVVACAAGAQELKFSGYYKNLFVASQTVVFAEDRYTLDLNRLRLVLKGNLSDHAAVDLEYDNEVLFGSYLQTAQFAAQKEQRPDQLWDLDSTYHEGGAWYGRHRLYRASVTVSLGATDLRLGRQRIAWGTGRFWSPVDLLNPLNPIALERDERPGVDAVLLERKLGPLSRLSAVYAPRDENGASSTAVNWHANAAGIDYSAVAGRFRGERVIGGDMATQLGDAGVRAELTHNEPDSGPSYSRAVFALDYAFANTLTLSGELYYNGAGTTNQADYDFASLFAGRIQNVAQHYFGAYAGYAITPLLKWANYFVFNLDDGSRYFGPSLTFSVRANLDLTIGVQAFSGQTRTEYGRFHDLYYAQVQWFF
jgi:hypothetical protein